MSTCRCFQKAKYFRQPTLYRRIDPPLNLRDSWLVLKVRVSQSDSTVGRTIGATKVTFDELLARSGSAVVDGWTWLTTTRDKFVGSPHSGRPNARARARMCTHKTSFLHGCGVGVLLYLRRVRGATSNKAATNNRHRSSCPSLLPSFCHPTHILCTTQICT